MSEECWFHGHEPIPADCYRVCLECWHAFATEEDLLAAEREICARMGIAPAEKAEDVWICPLCTHNF